jgi:iron complex outermembrane receptor protein
LVQDDISLRPDALTLTLGSKFEKYDTEALKPLPNVRLLWTPSDDQSWWTSASKATRTPSRIDRHGTILSLLPPEYTFQGQSLPRPAFLEASGKTSSEDVWSYELGWKQRLAQGLTIDASAYYNNYTHLRSGSFELANMRCLPAYGFAPIPGQPYAECYVSNPYMATQYLVLPATLANQYTGHSQGMEVWLDWQASRQHRLQANASRYAMTLKSTTDNAYSFDSVHSSPKWTGSMRWSYTPDKRTETDVVLRHVGALSDVLFSQAIPSYNAVDVRWAWNSSPEVQWSVTGRNLLMSRHLEFISELSDVARTLIGPSLTLGLRVQY